MKGYIQSNQTSLFFNAASVVGFGDDGFSVREISRHTANKIITTHHYSKKFYNASYIHLGVVINSENAGVLQFGYAMNPASSDSVVAGTAQDEYLELNRMWLCDSAERNSESKAISYAIKYIRKKYPKIKWIQSFADERCGKFGVVYQAANFDYYGEHKSIFWELDGIIYHNSLMTRSPELSKSAKHLQSNKYRAVSHEYRQFRYIYWIDRRCKDAIRFTQKGYPKHYREGDIIKSM